MTDDKRQPVPLPDAIAMLDAHDARVHTFRQGGPAIIGADWDLAALIEWIGKHGVEKSGSCASAMGHGLVGTDDNGPLFIATLKS